MNIGGLNTTNSAMRSGLAGIKRQSAKKQSPVQNSTAASSYAGTF